MKPNSGFNFFLLSPLLICFVWANSVFASLDTIKTGAFVINTGSNLQTIGNSLKPYGLVYTLVNDFLVPVKWAINPSKKLGGVDFSYNGVDYRAGAFIIEGIYRTPKIDSVINAWQALGVAGATLQGDLIVNIYNVLNGFSNVLIDEQNENLVIPYFNNAGISNSSYTVGLPADLDSCSDVYIMPHADPEWSTHRNLLNFNTYHNGFIWAGCHAPSVLESLGNPSDSLERMNFLSQNGLQCFEMNACGNFINEAHAQDPNSPFYYDSSLGGHPFMQFMGDLIPSTRNGSEQWYMPLSSGAWNSGAKCAIKTSDGAYPLEGVKLVFGKGFDNSNNGMVMYQAGHTAYNRGPLSSQIAVQRVFFNFIFSSSNENSKTLRFQHLVPDSFIIGMPFPVSVFSVEGGNEPYSFSWTSECFGFFDNPNSPVTSYTLVEPPTNGTCIITCTIEDACGRKKFQSIPVLISGERRLLDNPDLPVTCPYNIIFVLDESRSITGSNGTTDISGQVRNGALGLINSLNGTGSNVAVVEFNSQARRAVIGNSTNYQQVDSAYIAAFTNYISAATDVNGANDNHYDPEDYSCGAQCYTNWEAAFNLVNSMNLQNFPAGGFAQLVIFFTDGQPTAYINVLGNIVYGTNNNTTAQALAEATAAADAVKGQGSHIFVVGMPNPNLPEFNVQQISGTDHYPDLEQDFLKADYTISTSQTLEADLTNIARLVCSVDIELLKSASSLLGCIGDTIVFTLEVINTSDNTATGIEVQDVIPDGYTYLDDNGGSATSEVAGTVRWSIPILAGGGSSISLQITVLVDSSGNFTNTAQVTACVQPDIDSEPNNNETAEDDYDSASAMCCQSNADCDDGLFCTNDACISGHCTYTDRCNDGNPCTEDFCRTVEGPCLNIPILCNDGNPCTDDLCDNGVCIFPAINCDDFNPCTVDSCINGQCSNVLINCDDFNPCTIDKCVNGFCTHASVGCGVDISGFVLTENGTPVPGVSVQLSGSDSQSFTTGSDGYYIFTVPPGGNYFVTPSKSNDVALMNGVSTVDLIIMQNHILSSQMLTSPYKIIAADVNESGIVSTIDIIVIRAFIFGVISIFPTGKLWTFASSDFVFQDPLHPFPYDNSRSYSNLTSGLQGQNFIGIKLGDVNGSWNSSIP